MDENKTPLSTATDALSTDLPTPPADNTPSAFEPNPTIPPNPEATAPVQTPIEHEIVSPSVSSNIQTTNVQTSTPDLGASTSQSTTQSTIPPMPSLEQAPAAPKPSATPPAPEPTPNPVLNESEPNAIQPNSSSTNEPQTTTTEATPLGTTEAATTAESQPEQPGKPKKSNSLVLVVIVLTFITLALGGLVLWRTTQPATRSVEETITPPVQPYVEATENIVEEEVIIEQPEEFLEENSDQDTDVSSATSGAAIQGSCTQGGKAYADGEEVPALDSCNSCSCVNGQIACTAIACAE